MIQHYSTAGGGEQKFCGVLCRGRHEVCSDKSVKGALLRLHLRGSRLLLAFSESAVRKRRAICAVCHCCGEAKVADGRGAARCVGSKRVQQCVSTRQDRLSMDDMNDSVGEIWMAEFVHDFFIFSSFVFSLSGVLRWRSR